ncbi:hypothetical protein [Bacillus sp. B1-b2]|uniref:hypothetical protein n=1 Tax=Bacillus sp. B1-b2 TaxID=2653201 RepID=UPI001261B5F6|nr:hypothetical protein [Bacillus sp. B1-b2]KAB7673204.1 hypothetical protein F9279_01975 [Bacillus sp. B1-b2]
MQKKYISFPLLAALIAIVLLYTIGNILHIELLRISITGGSDSEGTIFETSISFIPIIVGFIVGFITDYIIKRNSKKNLV